jgi:putative ABC transport system permease protein
MNSWLRERAARFCSLFTRSKAAPELEEEFAVHLEMAVQDNLRRGMDLAEATRSARMRFGGVAQARESVREQMGMPLLESFITDVRYALRSLRKSPGFALVAILTLALGIGANTAMFSIVEAVMLRPLPYPEPERVAALLEQRTSGVGAPGQRMRVAAANLVSYKAENRSFAGIAGFESIGMNLTGSGTPERILGERVTADYFSVLGVQPEQGRAFLPEEDKPGGNRVVIVTHELWQNRFAADPVLLNSFLTLNGQRYQVIGIMPPGFQPLTQYAGPGRVGFLVPAAYSSKILAAHGDHEIEVAARLKPGVSLSEARADLDVISERLARQYPDTNRNVNTSLMPLLNDLTRNVRLSLIVLLAAVGMILVIACTNLANLLMVRASNRQHETAMRYALGASRLRVFRELATQCMVLAALGGSAGLFLADATKQLILAMAPANIPRLPAVAINWRVVLFSAALSVIAGGFFSFCLFPGFQGLKGSPIDSFRTARRSSLGRTAMRWRSALVVIQVSLCMVLLVGSGLMLRSFVSLLGVDLGFTTDRVLAMNVSLPDPRYPDAERRFAFFEELERNVSVLPGVEAAAFANRMPMRGGWGGGIHLDSATGVRENLDVDMQAVSGSYFRALSIGLVRGRFLTADDRTKSQPVAVVNSEFARRFLGSEDPLGKRIRISPQAPWVTIVGVVTDIHRGGKSEPVTPQVYFSASQTSLYPVRLADFVFRSRVEPRRLLAAVQKQIWAIDKDQPVTNVRTLQEIVSLSVADRRFQTMLLLILAGLALVLAAVGIYGVISYGVTQRRAEIGIRIALGASQRAILKSVVGQSMGMVATGVVLGVFGAYGLSKYLKTLLFAITPSDPLTYASIVFFLSMVGLAACWVPAMRAAKLDPTVALRDE